MLIPDIIILLLLTLSFQVTNIVATPCDNYNITVEVRNDTIQIIFPSTDITKLNRTVQCAVNSLVESIYGHVHNCTGLGYGQDGQIFIGMEHDNGTLETCFITYATKLQPPTLAYVDVPGDRVRLVPLPIPFTHSLNSLLLTVIANPPPTINIPSIYKFNVIFHDKQNETITYERTNISNFNLYPNSTFKYGLIPNLKHEIIFNHTIDSIGYALSNSTTTPISNVPYPYEVTNLRIQEDFYNIMLSWIDNHSIYDPIEFIVLCNSSENSMRKVSRNTTYTCQQTTFNEIRTISVQTRVAIPGYTHDRIAVVEVNVEQIPEIPLFDVFNKTENTIMIQWNYTNSVISNLFEYKIQCGLDDAFHQIDIGSNRYQCQSLEESTLYVITMSLANMNDTIKRLRSIQANTLLQKSQYRKHFYPPDFNAIRSVIIEWSPPNKSFEKIYVYCPSTYYTYEYNEVTSVMYVKCEVPSGKPYNVTFVTFKSGFEPAVLQFTDTAPIDSTTTTTTTTTSETTTTTETTTTETTTTKPAIITIMTSEMTSITISSSTTTPTTMGPSTEPTATTMDSTTKSAGTTMGQTAEPIATTMGPTTESTATAVNLTTKSTETTRGPTTESTAITIDSTKSTATSMGPATELTAITIDSTKSTTTSMGPATESTAITIDSTKSTATTMGPATELTAITIDSTKSTATSMGPATESTAITIDSTKSTATTMGPATELTAITIDSTKSSPRGWGD
ncbi:unnamed protein product [Rotaria sp. Silwood1]|nr:unnamed protein product [Rotaria sp. Silwood1]